MCEAMIGREGGGGIDTGNREASSHARTDSQDNAARRYVYFG